MRVVPRGLKSGSSTREESCLAKRACQEALFAWLLSLMNALPLLWMSDLQQLGDSQQRNSDLSLVALGEPRQQQTPSESYVDI